jgi:hypothetical protein
MASDLRLIEALTGPISVAQTLIEKRASALSIANGFARSSHQH